MASNGIVGRDDVELTEIVRVILADIGKTVPTL
jgi:hypothetical protein